MVKLTDEQVNAKMQFIQQYITSPNAASGSTLDANANVSTKNIATLSSELYKDFTIQINRKIIQNKIEKLFNKKLSRQYIRDLEDHLIYTHDETSLNPYCVAISMYPFLVNGLKSLGGESDKPNHLESFCGSFGNLIFAISSQFAGAVATPEFFICFDYFARKDYGDNYLESHKDLISQKLQHIVYVLNQPAAARGYQCVRADKTQLSTPNGYKYLHELSIGDECYVLKDGKIEIEKIENLNIYDYDGELIQFKGRNYQQTVTPNHRVVYKKPNTDKYEIKEAHELFGHSKLSLPIGSDGIDREDYPISDSLLKLCVATLTDGTIDGYLENDNNSGRISIYKSKNRYGYNEVKEWLTELGIGFSENTINSEFGDVQQIRLSVLESQLILRTIKHTKKAVPEFFRLLSKRQIDIVIDCWSCFDGNNDNEHMQLLQCDNDDIRNMIQEMVFLAGYGSEIYDRTMTKFNSDEECIVKYVKIFSRKDKRVSEYNLVNYKGKVWCPTTKAGVVIFREENGIPYISGNSVFWNLSTFDKYFYEGLFGKFCFPDGSSAKWETVNKLQKFFHSWFRKEREKELLTFPVVTHSFLTDGKDIMDTEWKDFVAEEMSLGGEFFIYSSDSVDSLSSCCRLRNVIDKNEFSYSLGAGGVMTGSKNVITININRVTQEGHQLEVVLDRVHKYQVAFDSFYHDMYDANMLTVYNAGFIDLKKQFLTVGVNGVVEAAEYLGYIISNNVEYKSWLKNLLLTFKDKNKIASEKYKVKFNTEFVPAENLGVKNAKWDRADGLVVKRNVYNSYMYIVEDDSLSVFDKMEIHGGEIINSLDGGSSLHDNEFERRTKEQYLIILKALAETGCNYYCENVPKTLCNSCGYKHPNNTTSCPKCGSNDVDKATRVIGYLKRVKNFSLDRQLEESARHYHV